MAPFLYALIFLALVWPALSLGWRVAGERLTAKREERIRRKTGALRARRRAF